MLVKAKQKVAFKTVFTTTRRKIFRKIKNTEVKYYIYYFEVICDEKEVNAKLIEKIEDEFIYLQKDGEIHNYLVTDYTFELPPNIDINYPNGRKFETQIIYYKDLPIESAIKELTSEMFYKFWQELKDNAEK